LFADYTGGRSGSCFTAIQGPSKCLYLGTQLLVELQGLSADISDYRGLPTHREYEAELYSRHRLKSQFWRRVRVPSVVIVPPSRHKSAQHSLV